MSETWSESSFPRQARKRNHGSSGITRWTMNSTTCRTNRWCRKTSRLLKKKTDIWEAFSKEFSSFCVNYSSNSTEISSNRKADQLLYFFFFNSWGIPNFKLLEMLTAMLLPVIVSLFNLVLSKLCHQPRYDHTDCHPSVYCINCSSIHKIQHRWKFTRSNEVLFSFYVLNGYWLPWLQPELPRSLINYLPAEHLASQG